MADKLSFDDRSRDFAQQELQHYEDTFQIERPRERYIDPAEEAMNTNPNISPPIHPRPN
jgi:hypothetical protein